MRCGFSIKRPSKPRRTFSIHRKIYIHEHKPQQPIIKDERLDAINNNFKSGVLNEHQALDQIKSLIEKIKNEDNINSKAIRASELSSQNIRLCSQFKEMHYEGRMNIVRPQNVINELNFAIKAIGSLSLISSCRKLLQNKVNDAFNEKQSKRYVGRINQLLKFAGREFTLTHKRQTPTDLSYVNFDELKRILNYVDNQDLKNLYLTLYCTGVRLGEAFMIDKSKLKSNHTVWIDKQLAVMQDPYQNKKFNLVEKEIKNRKNHHTIILKEGLEAVKAWADLSKTTKRSLRKRCQTPLIQAARKTFPELDDKLKQISPHDLRHSFVIHLLGLGVSIDKCARLIGDSIQTTERYYAGHSMSESELDIVQTILKKTC